MKLAKHELMTLNGRANTFGQDIANVFDALETLLTEVQESRDVRPESLYEAMRYVRDIKRAVQDVHNLNHELACLAAKVFLEKRHPDVDWTNIDVLRHRVNATGLDIRTDAARVAGMVKTTEPPDATDFGANRSGTP